MIEEGAAGQETIQKPSAPGSVTTLENAVWRPAPGPETERAMARMIDTTTMMMTARTSSGQSRPASGAKGPRIFNEGRYLGSGSSSSNLGFSGADGSARVITRNPLSALRLPGVL